MIIKFKSEFGIEKNAKQEIKFMTKLSKSEENGFVILEFVEPSKKVQNRIEYNQSIIRIIAGPTYLELELNQKIKNNFQTEQGLIILTTFLKEFQNENDKKISFSYDILNINNILVNSFKISLEISN